jgi:hypothetical protein
LQAANANIRFGHYELRTFVDGKPAFENIGSDPTEALARRDREIRNLKAIESAVGSDVQVQLPAQRRTLLELKHDFLEKVQLGTKNSV